MSLKVSTDAKLYYLNTGSRATWNASVTDGKHVGAAPSNLSEIANVTDIVWPLEFTEFDAKTRASAGFEAIVPTIGKTGFDITMMYDPTDAALLALEKACITKTNIALAVLDGAKATAGVMGLWADFSVVKMEKGEKLEEAQTITFSVKFGFSSVPPEVVKVA